ncbi:glycosyl transferase family 2 [Hoeflea marina]|uniref:Glycosyl transferase family 2 n=1 Tax=Hoeflea marina TaxID=274592 RepID=A0A317PTF0_9HYPH|nr:glycosyltransferase family A protein [Hoeflea marina]PWW03516.1 glycosyl transferase family 2 [Hoeflea marina]
MLPRISIITPTYNRREALLRAIDSVRSQSVGVHEHIIADDGSTDGTEAAVRALGDSRIVYHRLPERSGANAARNAAIALARAPLTTLLDSDDLYLPHRIETTLAIFEGDPETTVSISSFRTEGAGREIVNVNPAGFLAPADLELAVMAQVIYMAGTSLTMRTEALRAVGGFDASLPRYQDGDLLLRLARSHGARLSGTIDWVKTISGDAITALQPAVPAYAALYRSNPGYPERFPEIFRYMIARAVLADLMRLRPDLALRSVRASRKPPLNCSIRDLICGYRSGKRERRRARAEIRRKLAASAARHDA